MGFMIQQSQHPFRGFLSDFKQRQRNSGKCRTDDRRYFPVVKSDQFQILSDNDIQLEYLYAFVGRASNDAVVVLRVDDRPKTMDIFEKNNIKVLDDKEVYGI